MTALPLRTPRLVLIPATTEVLEAELSSPAALGMALGTEVPASWPPELYDADAVRWTLRWLAEHGDDAGWALYYVASVAAGDATRHALLGLRRRTGAAR